MGLRYVAAESAEVMAALSENLATGLGVLEQLRHASEHLVATVGTGELSGKAYAAVGRKFQDGVLPETMRAVRWLESVHAELAVYRQADAVVNRFGVLFEDELEIQLASTRIRRDATEELMSVNAMVADSLVLVPWLSESLRMMNQRLAIVFTHLVEYARLLQHKLDALREFDARTRHLFQHQTLESYVLAVTAGKSSGVGGAAGSLVMDPAMLQILSGKLTEEEVAAQWRLIRASGKYTKADVAGLPLSVLAKLASMNGVPAWVQHVAGHKLMKTAVGSNEGAATVYGLLGFEGSDVSLDDFKEQVRSLDEAFTQAEKNAKRHLPDGTKVQLVNFGNHDGFVTAAVSLGDLDNAKNVAVNVSGMNSEVKTIGDGVSGALEIFKSARLADKNSSNAVVTWIGYKPPGEIEVFTMDRAHSGASELAGFLNGIGANRASRGADIAQFSVLAHSYGSTTAAVALQLPQLQDGLIDNFVTYGSAGFEAGTKISDLKVKNGNVYSTYAKGDGWAQKPIGDPDNKVDPGSRVDPRKLPGVTEFFAEGGLVNPQSESIEKRTTMHGMYAEEDAWSVANPGWIFGDGKVGYLSNGTSAMNTIGEVVATGKPGVWRNEE